MGMLDEPESADRRRGPLIVAAGLLAALAVGGAAWWLLRQPAGPRPPASPAPRRTPTAKAAPTPSPVPGPTTGTRQVEPSVPGHTGKLVARLDAQVGRLRIDADVPGANVFLDRKFLGTTPVEARDLTSGSHRLNVSSEGYEMYAETIDVSPGSRDVMVRFKEVRLDEQLPVLHRHGMGSCRGTLFATTAGLRYDTAEQGDAFASPFASLEPLQLDYLKKNLRVKLRGGRTYNFTADSADSLLSFQKAVEAARKRL